MIPKLRGHHLICLHFFKGEGYSEEFIKNIYNVLKNQKMKVADGADDICTKCPNLVEGKCASREYSDEDIRAQDTEALRLLELEPGMVVGWQNIAEMLPPILDEWRARFCNECKYSKVCFG
ncbi:MAG: DUF1284 domain-containing protein [Candidatus Methanoperedens sp.]|jgi:hypothetical protein|nr:DUF1284 domain-containing protein [Candidatus Methanoperedens sp.]PKL54093.1 MAG: DUF1284 domain-containing protein [Candidatus Methanoperedenaceae archaeon HGW-Methanoperedenaceae-1]